MSSLWLPDGGFRVAYPFCKSGSRSVGVVLILTGMAHKSNMQIYWEMMLMPVAGGTA